LGDTPVVGVVSIGGAVANWINFLGEEVVRIVNEGGLVIDGIDEVDEIANGVVNNKA